jgi:hypothetical protein
VSNLKGHVERFLDAFPKYRDWHIEYVGLSPLLGVEERRVLHRQQVIPQDLVDLTTGL